MEKRHIDFTMYGAPNGFSAMAQTVGKPTAIAAKMILNGESIEWVSWRCIYTVLFAGEIKKHGIVTPTSKDIYKPILRALKREGIEASVMNISWLYVSMCSVYCVLLCMFSLTKINGSVYTMTIWAHAHIIQLHVGPISRALVGMAKLISSCMQQLII